MVGVVDEVLVDRAFVAERASTAVEIWPRSTSWPPTAADNVRTCSRLGGGALVRGAGRVGADAAASGSASTRHRGETVVTVDEVHYVDNSKATNVLAADVALAAAEHVVWIAGGLAKGGVFDDLSNGTASRLRAVVLVGTDQDLLAEAARRHAPDVPVIEVPAGETDPMEQRQSLRRQRVARPGDACCWPRLRVDGPVRRLPSRGRAFARP